MQEPTPAIVQPAPTDVEPAAADPGPAPVEPGETPVVPLSGTPADTPGSGAADVSASEEGAAAPTAITEDPAGSPTSALSWLDFFKPEGIPYALVVLLLMAFAARFVTRECERLGERFGDRRLVIQQTGSFIRFLVYAIGLTFAVLSLFELNEQMMLAIGGSLAVAGGFALKDLVASLIAGVIILIDRPFQVGDRVTFSGYYGEVTHIGLRSVRLMTLDDTQVTIPNNTFLTDAVASGNAGAVDIMIQVDLYIGIDQDLEEARRLLSEVVTTSRYVNLHRKWSVLASQELQESYLAIRLRASAYVLVARLEKDCHDDITHRALQAFAGVDIGPPAVLHRGLGVETAS